MKRIYFGWLTMVVILLSGCVPVLDKPVGTGIVLTVETEEAILTKDAAPGEEIYNENLISWVDFFIYEGTNTSQNAVYHVRKESGKTGSDSFSLNLDLGSIFPEGITQASVFAIANADMDLSSLIDTRLSALQSMEYTTTFVNENDPDNPNNLQSHFLMIGEGTLTKAQGSASSIIHLTRLASKLTIKVHVAERVELKDDNDQLKEIWEPVLKEMTVYLENGVKYVKIGGEETEKSETEKYFSYRNNPMRFFEKDKTVPTPLLDPTIVTEEEVSKVFYNTYPMYMYPQHWVYYANKGNEREPFIKLALTWRRPEMETPQQSSLEKEYYYKIVFPDPDDLKKINSNYWYDVAIEVSILGSETNDELVELPITCSLAEWNRNEIVHRTTDIGNARYLFVDKEEWVLNNVSSKVTFPYVSSHPVTLTIDTLMRPYYGTKDVGYHDNTGGWDVIVPYPKEEGGDGEKYAIYPLSQAGNWLWLEQNNSVVAFRHELKNDYKDPSFDYSPYYLKYTIVQEDRPEYKKTIIVRQYPAIYIDACHNSDETTSSTPDHYEVNKKGEAKSDRPVYTSDHWGYVFINGRDQDDPEWPDPLVVTAPPKRERLVRVDRKDPPGNDNPDHPSKDPIFLLTSAEKKEYQWQTVYYTGGSRDIFGIHVTVLPEHSEFVIGDPRTNIVDNLDAYTKVLGEQRGFNIAPSLTETVDNDGKKVFQEAEERSLHDYYPTEGSSRTEFMIAPFFRVSSKYTGIEYSGVGGLTGLTMEYARYRCAALQEDGFPAGRWRLPTRGEIEFIANLSSNEVFETLFNKGGSYWSANGVVSIDKSGKVTINPKGDNALLRCVYDSWYWGDEQLPASNAEDDNLPNRNHFYWGDRAR